MGSRDRIWLAVVDLTKPDNIRSPVDRTSTRWIANNPSQTADLYASHRSNVMPRNTGTKVLWDACWPARNQRSSCCGHWWLKKSSDTSTTKIFEECTAASVAAAGLSPRLRHARKERRPSCNSRRCRKLPNNLSSPAKHMKTSQVQSLSWNARLGVSNDAAALREHSALAGCTETPVVCSAQSNTPTYSLFTRHNEHYATTP